MMGRRGGAWVVGWMDEEEEEEDFEVMLLIVFYSCIQYLWEGMVVLF